MSPLLPRVAAPRLCDTPVAASRGFEQALLLKLSVRAERTGRESLVLPGQLLWLRPQRIGLRGERQSRDRRRLSQSRPTL